MKTGSVRCSIGMLAAAVAASLFAGVSPAGADLLEVSGAVLAEDDELLAGWTAEGDAGYVHFEHEGELLVSAGSSDDEPLFVGWTSAAPATAAGYEPSSEHVCKRGATTCVDLVVEAMTRRFDRLAAECDHNAAFSLVYLRTTEEYRRTIEDPDFFEDTAFVNHEDAVFAKYYFDAFDDWYGKGRWWKVNDVWRHRGGRADQVPPAWEVAFRASDGRAVSGMGSVLLGMSAHINRDLPFVLESIGLVAPDGSSRKIDHDRVNQFLNRVTIPAIHEAARRFDATIDDGNVEATTLDESVNLQIVMSWREEAWRHAERLAAADTRAEWDAVAASIEEAAHLEAVAIRDAYAYDGVLTDSSARDTWCEEHWDDEV